MKEKLLKIIGLLALVLCFSLCGCSTQESVDTFEFCKSYNQAFGKDTIQHETILKEDEEEQCCYTFIDIAQKTALLTLNTNDAGAVTGIALTAVEKDASFSEAELQVFFETYIRLTATLLHKTYEAVKLEITEHGLLPEHAAFTPYDYEVKTDDAQFSIIANQEILTMYAEKQ